MSIEFCVILSTRRMERLISSDVQGSFLVRLNYIHVNKSVRIRIWANNFADRRFRADSKREIIFTRSSLFPSLILKTRTLILSKRRVEESNWHILFSHCTDGCKIETPMGFAEHPQATSGITHWNNNNTRTTTGGESRNVTSSTS